MKSSVSLAVLFLSIIYLNPVKADFQLENRASASQLSSEGKIYVPHERLHFSKDGIFVLMKNDQWASVSQLGHDSSGHPPVLSRSHLVQILSLVT